MGTIARKCNRERIKVYALKGKRKILSRPYRHQFCKYV